MPPLLFLVYKRIDLVKIVFQEIRKYKPKEFYIASDGPKSQAEKKLCDDVRSYIISNIDWECNIYTLFREKNLGCKIAVSSAIDWFFQHVEEGIILEDDCLPTESFFIYCEKMLNVYKDDVNVMHISGCNYLEKFKSKSEHFFSEYAAIWGWATWRRAWEKYDLYLTFINQENSRDFFINHSNNDYNQYYYWRKIYDKLEDGSFNTWDYSWIFSIWNAGGFCVTPCSNLVKNLGFSEEALHTVNINSPLARLSYSTIDFQNLKKNKFNKKYLKYDLLVFYRIFLEEYNVTYKRIKQKTIKIFPSLRDQLFDTQLSVRDKIYLIRTKIFNNK